MNLDEIDLLMKRFKGQLNYTKHIATSNNLKEALLTKSLIIYLDILITLTNLNNLKKKSVPFNEE